LNLKNVQLHDKNHNSALLELSHLNQVDLNEVRIEKIDCLIATAGSQARCLYLAEKLHQQVPKKVLLVSGKEDPKKSGNKFISAFSSYDFTIYETADGEYPVIEKLLRETCHLVTHQVNIVVDYSCMPKKWYAMFIDCITRNSYFAERVNLYLSYTPKVFERHPEKHAVEYIGPIVFNRDQLNDKKPVSLIAALDHHHHNMAEAIRKVKPQKLFAFIPHCAHDPEYNRLVMDKNKSLLDRLDKNSIVQYDADRPEEINTLLTSYCLDERIGSEVMILPQGPKTFSMMSMLLSVRYPDVKLWEIILKDQKINPDHGQPVAHPIIVKVSFISDELD
jgi:hypothetical protein